MSRFQQLFRITRFGILLLLFFPFVEPSFAQSAYDAAPALEVTHLAGGLGGAGSVDGIRSAARFKGPAAIWGDDLYLYVADSGNHTIRRITKATGDVITVAGSPGVSGSSDGVRATARFNKPHGLWGDGTYLYVADTGNNLIRRIEVSTCTVTTLASVKQFSQMWGDGNNLYVVNWTSPLTVYQISLFTNEVSVLATIDVNIGGRPPGPVVGVWGDDANIYVGETLPFVVSVVHSINRSTGAVRLVASSATQSQSLLRIPQSLWSDGTYLYGGGVRIRVSTGEVTSFPQASGSGVWGDRDNLYV